MIYLSPQARGLMNSALTQLFLVALATVFLSLAAVRFVQWVRFHVIRLLRKWLRTSTTETTRRPRGQHED